MAKGSTNPKVDFYFERNGKWQKELRQLRMIVLDCGLTEKLKWGTPCYTYSGKASRESMETFQESNIVLIHDFKEYCALLFFKGALLKDPGHILIQQTKNVQAARQIRFTNTREIVKLKPALKACIYEAIEVEKAGLKVKYKKTSQFVIPEELQKEMDKSPSLKRAFGGLTPGRQRGYLFYFAQPKQSKTRASRVEKWVPQILKGKGLND